MQLVASSKIIARWSIIAAVAAIYWQSLHATEFEFKVLLSSFPAIRDLVSKMFPPDWSYLPQLYRPLIETIQVGIISSVLASILCVPLAVLGSRNLSPSLIIYYPVRLVLTIFRAVSEIIWALIFVVAVGLGPFAGVIALIIFAVGTQGKLLSEAIEASKPGSLEALASVGASKWKIFLFGAWPDVWPQYVAICLYYWDHNTRSAAILGFVGGGGLGYNLLFSLSSYQFQQASLTIIVLVALIVVIDQISWKLREAIL